MQTAAKSQKAKRLLKRIIKSWQLYLLIAPATIYFVVFHYWPMYGVQIAFRNYTAKKGILGSPWVGLSHFTRFVTGPNFWNLLRNTLSISLANLLFGFPIAVILALVINELRSKKMKRFVQTVTYAPHFISTVVIVSMLGIFLNVNTGMINRFLSLFGRGPYDFMTVGPWFSTIYVISDIWASTGWNSIVFLAALSNVDVLQHEAATVDGATRLQRIWYVNLPAILPTLVVMFILRAGRVMTVGYEKAYLMQNALNLEYSELISTYVYKVGLINTQFSFSTAVGLLNSLCNVALLLLVNFISKKVSDTSLL